MSWLSKLRDVFKSSREVCERVERIDRENKEVRHDLRNTQAKVDALKMLISGMRGEVWERPRDDR